MCQTSRSKYDSYCLEKLNRRYEKVLLFSEKGQFPYVEWLMNSLKDAASRQRQIKKNKETNKKTNKQNKKGIRNERNFIPK